MKERIAFLRSQLRRISCRWKPIWQTKLKARRPYIGPLKRQKYEYQCNSCKLHFPSRKVQVDHIIPVGSFRTLDDLPGYVERLLCDGKNLQMLCLTCHKAK